MKFLNSDFTDLEKNGFILKKNILNRKEIDKIKSIILNNTSGKGGADSYYASNFKKLLFNILKMDFRKSSASIFFMNLKKKLNLDDIATNFFKEKAELTMVDGYYNKKTNQDILPWHSDQAYGGAKTVKEIISPDSFYFKFFFYLTKVTPNNGCTSYIPGSHKITYAVRKSLFNKEIEYQPFWNVKDLVRMIEKKENIVAIKANLEKDINLEEFLDKCRRCISDKYFSNFDFTAEPGDLLVFNDGGVHRGSNPSQNDRVVLRYLYSKQKLN